MKRCFDEGKYPFDSIMGKSIQIILSNFEGNDKNIFGTLDSKVDPKFLVNIIDSKLNEIGVKSKS